MWRWLRRWRGMFFFFRNWLKPWPRVALRKSQILTNRGVTGLERWRALGSDVHSGGALSFDVLEDVRQFLGVHEFGTQTL